MSNTIPCNNPAHGVQSHIVGSAAAIECTSSARGAASEGLPNHGMPTPATPALELNAPEELNLLEDVTESMGRSIGYPTAAVGELSNEVSKAFVQEAMIDPTISTKLGNYVGTWVREHGNKISSHDRESLEASIENLKDLSKDAAAHSAMIDFAKENPGWKVDYQHGILGMTRLVSTGGSARIHSVKRHDGTPGWDASYRKRDGQWFSATMSQPRDSIEKSIADAHERLKEQ